MLQNIVSLRTDSLAMMRELTALHARDLSGNRTRDGLSPEQRAMADELQQRDREVRMHEQTHLQAAGPYAAGPAHYDYQMGPDGKMYAIGGSVEIAATTSASPEENQRRERTLSAAATAVGDPSIQDQFVAMTAQQMSGETSDSDTNSSPSPSGAQPANTIAARFNPGIEPARTGDQLNAIA